MSDHQNFIGT